MLPFFFQKEQWGMRRLEHCAATEPHSYLQTLERLLFKSVWNDFCGQMRRDNCLGQKISLKFSKMIKLEIINRRKLEKFTNMYINWHICK